jgi:hypothetical protein
VEKKYEITVSSPDDKGKRHEVTHEVTGKGISPISCYNNAVKQVNEEVIGKKKGHEIFKINGPKVYYDRQKG